MAKYIVSISVFYKNDEDNNNEDFSLDYYEPDFYEFEYTFEEKILIISRRKAIKKAKELKEYFEVGLNESNIKNYSKEELDVLKNCNSFGISISLVYNKKGVENEILFKGNYELEKYNKLESEYYLYEHNDPYYNTQFQNCVIEDLLKQRYDYYQSSEYLIDIHNFNHSLIIVDDFGDDIDEEITKSYYRYNGGVYYLPDYKEYRMISEDWDFLYSLM